MNPEQVQKEIIDEFTFLENWEDKYKHIIDLGKEIPAFPEMYRKEENKVRGCQAQVWLHAEFREGKVFFEADSDAFIVKGLVALLLRIFSGQTPRAILDTRLTFIESVGLSSHLSPTRSNGLAAMEKQMRAYAIAFSTRG